MRVEAVGELGHLASGLVGEGEWAVPCGNPLVEPLRVPLRLDDYPFEGVPRGLRLDDPNGPSIGIEQVVGGSGPDLRTLLPL